MAGSSGIRVDKRRTILDAAGPVFGDAGYERASVDAIATLAGVSKPTIYAYFGSKDGLFRESLVDTAQQVSAVSGHAVRELDVHPDRWQQSLRALAHALVDRRRSECGASLTRLVLAESTRDPSLYGAVRAAGVDSVVEALAGRLAMLGNARLVDVPDPEAAARDFIALTQSRLDELTHGSVVGGDAQAIADAIDHGVDVFLRAYRAAESG